MYLSLSGTGTCTGTGIHKAIRDEFNVSALSFAHCHELSPAIINLSLSLLRESTRCFLVRIFVCACFAALPALEHICFCLHLSCTLHGKKKKKKYICALDFHIILLNQHPILEVIPGKQADM